VAWLPLSAASQNNSASSLRKQCQQRMAGGIPALKTAPGEEGSGTDRWCGRQVENASAGVPEGMTSLPKQVYAVCCLLSVCED